MIGELLTPSPAKVLALTVIEYDSVNPKPPMTLYESSELTTTILIALLRRDSLSELYVTV